MNLFNKYLIYNKKEDKLLLAEYENKQTRIWYDNATPNIFKEPSDFYAALTEGFNNNTYELVDFWNEVN